MSKHTTFARHTPLDPTVPVLYGIFFLIIIALGYVGYIAFTKDNLLEQNVVTVVETK